MCSRKWRKTAACSDAAAAAILSRPRSGPGAGIVQVRDIMLRGCAELHSFKAAFNAAHNANRFLYTRCLNSFVYGGIVLRYVTEYGKVCNDFQ